MSPISESDEMNMKYLCLILDEGEVWVHVFLEKSNVYIVAISLKGAPHPPGDSVFILICGDYPPKGIAR